MIMANRFPPTAHVSIRFLIRFVSAALILSLVLASSAIATEPKFPKLTGRVVDDANVLSTPIVGQLTLMLADHERATGEQVVVVTLASLQGYTIEDYGYQLGRHWGIGQKGVNNGVLLIVAPKEHKVRIEVGYGLEGTLTDATSRTIIENDILPAFKRGDFNGGVVAGTQAIVQVLGGNPLSAETSAASAPVQYQPFSTLPMRAKLGIIVTFALFFGVFGLIIVMVIAGWINHRNDPGRYSGGWSGGGGSFGGGSDGGGGGFSGGGGSFGGGGASGSW
jgi:uncharacterized protein